METDDNYKKDSNPGLTNNNNSKNNNGEMKDLPCGIDNKDLNKNKIIDDDEGIFFINYNISS